LGSAELKEKKSGCRIAEGFVIERCGVGHFLLSVKSPDLH